MLFERGRGGTGVLNGVGCGGVGGQAGSGGERGGDGDGLRTFFLFFMPKVASATVSFFFLAALNALLAFFFLALVIKNNIIINILIFLFVKNFIPVCFH